MTEHLRHMLIEVTELEKQFFERTGMTFADMAALERLNNRFKDA